MYITVFFFIEIWLNLLKLLQRILLPTYLACLNHRLITYTYFIENRDLAALTLRFTWVRHVLCHVHDPAHELFSIHVYSKKKKKGHQFQS